MAIRELLSVRDDDDQVWVTHYSSNHQILLVGEGDFSFSHSLAISFGSASNISASSLDSYDDVVRKYKNARSNLETLKRLGASLYHGVDATKLHFHPDLHFRRFDRIIFNFPHAGFHGKEADPRLIRKHRELVFGFFRSASHMLRADGEIHVSHKNKEPFCQWNLEGLASRCFLVLVHCVAFEKSKYPGYENKRGDGSRCDKPFTLGECSTFKFRLCRVAKELYAEKVKSREMKEQESKRLQAFPNEQVVSFDQFQGVSQRPVSFDLRYRGDHNLGLVLDPMVQSRQRASPLDLPYYQEHRHSQFKDVSIHATLRSESFSLERNHTRFQDNSVLHHKLMSTERSGFHFQDTPFEATYYRQEHFLERSSFVNGVSHDRERHWTSFPHPYTRESPERRYLLCQDFPIQAPQEPFFEYSNRFNGVSHGVYNGEVRTSFPHPHK